MVDEKAPLRVDNKVVDNAWNLEVTAQLDADIDVLRSRGNDFNDNDRLRNLHRVAGERRAAIHKRVRLEGGCLADSYSQTIRQGMTRKAGLRDGGAKRIDGVHFCNRMGDALRRHREDFALHQFVAPFAALRPGEKLVHRHFLFCNRVHRSIMPCRPGCDNMRIEIMEEEIVLVIGDKAWSSWSLRPWLAAKAAKIPFREEQVKLRQADTTEAIARHSGSGRIPVLKRGALTVWDSLAICEYLAELAPQARLWPEDASARAVARSISAEMHSSFIALRKEFPMDFHARFVDRVPSEQTRADISRIAKIWLETRRGFGAGGQFLFGAFTIADAMYAPVATRFHTYGVDLAAYGDDGTAAAYAEAVLAMPEMQEWGDGAAR